MGGLDGVRAGKAQARQVDGDSMVGAKGVAVRVWVCPQSAWRMAAEAPVRATPQRRAACVASRTVAWPGEVEALSSAGPRQQHATVVAAGKAKGLALRPEQGCRRARAQGVAFQLCKVRLRTRALDSASTAARRSQSGGEVRGRRPKGLDAGAAQGRRMGNDQSLA